MSSLFSFDVSIFKFINTYCACRNMDHLMLTATLFGEGIVQTGFCLVFILVGLIMDKLYLRRAGYAGLIAYALSGIVSQVMKHIWDRPRPLLALYDVHIVEKPLFMHSFPSGHTTTAFAAAFAYAAFLPKLRFVVIPIAIATAVSRVYLGVHFPTDVIAGAIIGSLTGILSARSVSSKNKKSAQCSLSESAVS